MSTAAAAKQPPPPAAAPPKGLPAGPLDYQRANPKKADSKSWARYERYKAARDAAHFLDLGGTRADLLYDFRHGFVKGPALAAWEAQSTAKHATPKKKP